LPALGRHVGIQLCGGTPGAAGIAWNPDLEILTTQTGHLQLVAAPRAPPEYENLPRYIDLFSNAGLMLKSTYKPSANRPAPLPQGWTEHTAPTGHTYYYNANTKESTYTRPGAAEVSAQLPPSTDPSFGRASFPGIPNLSDPNVANAFLAQLNAPAQTAQRGGHGARGRGGYESRPRPQPIDKPRSRVPIPDNEPWVLIYTKYGRRFVHNAEKNTSFWRIPDKLKPAILEIDQARIRGKAADDAPVENATRRDSTADAGTGPRAEFAAPAAMDDSSEYEEVEVTDDEDEGGDHPSKRQRTDEPLDEGPIELTEADFAAQLQLMGDDYGLEPGEYDDGHADEWPEGAAGLDFPEEDARALFKDLLNDYRISPYSPWDKLIEEGKVFDDPRYTVLTTMKARRDTWEEWSREQIKELRERRSKEEKTDPRIPFMAFLQERATPKLYWPEFKRKYKKEAPMRDTALSDKDREKWYRDHIGRLKLPQPTLRSDLTTLLKSQPLSALNNRSLASHLPPKVLADVRYISLDPKVRDPLVEAFIQTLGPPPEDGEAATEGDEAARKAREARERRERALQERDRVAAEQKRQLQRNLETEKARLRERERELEAATHVGRRGLQSQLAAAAAEQDENGQTS
jgi:hypothetical protein